MQAVALEQDNRIIHKNMEATTVEGSHVLDSGLNFDLDNVDETHAAWEIENQEILDVDMVSMAEEYMPQSPSLIAIILLRFVGTTAYLNHDI